jgi:hypothetical protein
MDGLINFTFIEPYPNRLYSLLSERDKSLYEIIDKPIQDVEINILDALNTGDILFIDSLHVVKVDSDVNYLLFEILPRLKPGVLVHFLEYPKQWIKSGVVWNETYFLRAFLQYSTSFEILYLNSFMG